MALEGLDRILEEYRQHASELRRQLDSVSQRIHAIEAAREALAHQQDVAPKTRSRTLKADWADLLRHIGEVGGASLDDSERYLRSKNVAVNRNTLRSQMALYANSGWVRRIRKGVFELTAQGLKKVERPKSEYRASKDEK